MSYQLNNPYKIFSNPGNIFSLVFWLIISRFFLGSILRIRTRSKIIPSGISMSSFITGSITSVFSIVVCGELSLCPKKSHNLWDFISKTRIFLPKKIKEIPDSKKCLTNIKFPDFTWFLLFKQSLCLQQTNKTSRSCHCSYSNSCPFYDAFDTHHYPVYPISANLHDYHTDLFWICQAYCLGVRKCNKDLQMWLHAEITYRPTIFRFALFEMPILPSITELWTCFILRGSLPPSAVLPVVALTINPIIVTAFGGASLSINF